MTAPRKKKTGGKKAEPSTRILGGRFQFTPDPVLDQTPVAMPAGCGRPRSLQEMLATMVRDYVEMEKEEAGFESWDEANDFEPDPDEDDLLDMSPYTFSDLQGRDEPPEDGPYFTEEVNPSAEEPEPQNGDPTNPNSEEPVGLEPQNHLPKEA